MPLNTEVERWSTHLHLHGGRYAPRSSQVMDQQ